MRHAPPVVGRGGELHAEQLLFLVAHIPEPEVDPEATVRGDGGLAVDQGLGADGLPGRQPRLDADVEVLLGEAGRVQRPEQARAVEVGGDHLGDVGAHLAVAGEVGDGDGQGLDRPLVDVDLGLRPGRRGGEPAQSDEGQAERGEDGAETHEGHLLVQGVA